jgi:hypothetical protein
VTWERNGLAETVSQMGFYVNLPTRNGGIKTGNRPRDAEFPKAQGFKMGIAQAEAYESGTASCAVFRTSPESGRKNQRRLAIEAFDLSRQAGYYHIAGLAHGRHVIATVKDRMNHRS